jgi:hypothetical protein
MKCFAAASLGLALSGAAGSDGPLGSPSETLRTVTPSLPLLSVPARTLSMDGPESGQELDLGDQDLYVRRFRAITRDRATGGVDPRFVYHAHLGPTTSDCCADGAPPQLRVARTLAGLQGAPETVFPDGFAVRFKAGHSLAVTAMALNSDPDGVAHDVVYDVEIDYWEGEDARAHGIKELEVIWLRLEPEQGHAMHDMPMHWTVPPGRHTYASRPGLGKLPGRSRVHYIAVHLHAFGEWVELYDVTAARSVWRGEAETDAELRYLTRIDHYASPEGLLLHADHEYELRAGYANHFDEPIDAMATMRLFYRAGAAGG